MSNESDARPAWAIRYHELAEQEQRLASLAIDPQEAAQHRLIAELYERWADDDND
jgi:hypothetical protein